MSTSNMERLITTHKTKHEPPGCFWMMVLDQNADTGTGEGDTAHQFSACGLCCRLIFLIGLLLLSSSFKSTVYVCECQHEDCSCCLRRLFKNRSVNVRSKRDLFRVKRGSSAVVIIQNRGWWVHRLIKFSRGLFPTLLFTHIDRCIWITTTWHSMTFHLFTCERFGLTKARSVKGFGTTLRRYWFKIHDAVIERIIGYHWQRRKAKRERMEWGKWKGKDKSK